MVYQWYINGISMVYRIYHWFCHIQLNILPFVYQETIDYIYIHMLYSHRCTAQRFRDFPNQSILHGPNARCHRPRQGHRRVWETWPVATRLAPPVLGGSGSAATKCSAWQGIDWIDQFFSTKIDAVWGLPSGYLLHSHGKTHPFLIGKPSINGPFSMAMLNNQMVVLFWGGKLFKPPVLETPTEYAAGSLHCSRFGVWTERTLEGGIGIAVGLAVARVGAEHESWIYNFIMFFVY